MLGRYSNNILRLQFSIALEEVLNEIRMFNPQTSKPYNFTIYTPINVEPRSKESYYSIFLK